MKQLFIDTGFLIALEMSDDQYHESAREYWRNLIILHLLLSQQVILLTKWSLFSTAVTDIQKPLKSEIAF